MGSLLRAVLLTVSVASLAGCADDSCSPHSPSQSRVIRLTPDGTGDYPTIQAAVDSADSADVIELSPGTYLGEGNRDIRLNGKSLLIRSSEDDPLTTIIDCAGDGETGHRGFTFDSAEGPDCLLQSLTIANGFPITSPQDTGSCGGAVLCDGASPTFRNCRFLRCEAAYGGAAYCRESSAEFIGCSFRGNQANFSGGGISIILATPALIACVLDSNQAGSGGGAIIVSSSPRLDDCTFAANWAHSGGGLLVRHTASEPEILNCRIDKNDARRGGGFYLDFCQPTIQTCVIVGNRADLGGGFFLEGKQGTISHCEVVRNEAYAGAGFLFASTHGLALLNCTVAHNSIIDTMYHYTSGGAAIAMGPRTQPQAIERTILYGNTGAQLIALVWDASPPQLSLTCCDVFNNELGDYVGLLEGEEGRDGNVSLDPMFCDPEVGDYRLQHGSPCSADSSECGGIGAWPAGCDRTGTEVGDRRIILQTTRD